MPTVAESLVGTLAAAGVKRIYGIVGDSLNGITDAMRRQKTIEWVHVRHEEVAAFAAGADAHVTGELAVCAGSCGPGNLHLINGLFDCHRSSVPVLAIAAHIPSSEIGSDYFQETHPEFLFQGCSYYCQLVSSPAQMPRALETAMTTAIARLGVAVIVLSGDVALQSAEHLSTAAYQVAFVGIFIARVLQAGCNPFLAMGMAVGIGAVSGALMGCLIYFFELPPFLVTLAGLFCLRGLGFVINPESIGIDHPFYGQVLPQLSILLAPKAVLPFTAMCFLACVAIGTLLASFTRFGRNVYAIGSNENSARLMGLPIGRTKIMTYALAGAFSALGGVVATFYMQSGNPASFVGLELDAIASVVIGGTLLTGGVGFIPGTLMGVLILGLIQQIIIFNGTLNSWWTKIVIGALLLVFIVLQKLISRRGEQGTIVERQ